MEKKEGTGDLLQVEIAKKDEEIKTLKRELKKKGEQNQRLKKELTSNSIIKRWKIGRYLHDNLAQQLISAKISIDLLKSELSEKNLITACDEIKDIIDEGINDVRNLSHDIVPKDVEQEGMEHAFGYLKERVERRHGIKCTLEVDKVLHKIDSRKVATHLYHIAQEAIKNAVVHGEAENIKIVLIEHDQQMYLHIKDDGRGFDATNNDNGMGIMIMKHRAEEMGGTLRVKDPEEYSDYTTCVTCSLPLELFTGK